MIFKPTYNTTKNVLAVGGIKLRVFFSRSLSLFLLWEPMKSDGDDTPGVEQVPFAERA